MGKKIPMWQCVVVFVCMVLLLIWSIIKDTGGEAHIALIFAAGIASIVAMANGWKWAYLEAGILAAINRTMQACIILMIVGGMLATWTAGGVVPSMMYYGIKVISPKIFLFTACILCSIVSLATGSSWSTAGSMGVALIGVGTALGFPAAMTAGAVVSGAYFGDKMSPLSDTTNLAPAVSGATLFDHIGHMIYTTGTTVVIALIVYLVMGFTHSGGTADTDTIDLILGFITENYTVGIIYLLPPVVVIAMVVLKAPAIPALLGGAILGIPFMFMQGVEITSIFDIMNNGTGVDPEGMIENLPSLFPHADATQLENLELILSKLSSLLSADGVQGMLWTVSLIIFAMCFGGVVDCTGIMATLAGSLLKVANTRGMLVTATVLSCILINAICCDQYLSIILPGRIYKEAFEDMRLKPKNLSRCLEDSGTMTSNLFPWNTCGATMRSFLGVDSGYIPYAILSWLNPVVSIIFGFTGITMEKMTDDEYQEILRRREQEKAEALAMLNA